MRSVLVRPKDWHFGISVWRWGVACDLELLTDSSAAKGIVMRQGAGRVKHLDIKTLWIQEREDRGELAVKKIPRLLNCSDLLTHHWTEQEGQRHLDGMALQRRSRPSSEDLSPPPRGGLQVCMPSEPSEQEERRASVDLLQSGSRRNDVQASTSYSTRDEFLDLGHLAQGDYLSSPVQSKIVCCALMAAERL